MYHLMCENSLFIFKAAWLSCIPAKKIGTIKRRSSACQKWILSHENTVDLFGILEEFLHLTKKFFCILSNLFHVNCGGVKIGGKEKIAVMAGPCSIEGAEQALRIAQGVKAGGATLFRGGAYKPRTSPYSFQGLETEGILDMVKAREATGMPIVSELMSEDRIPEFEEYVDVVQIGARNMQNFQLLKAVGKMHKPVLLKRGLCNTIEEWIMSAEYIMAGGNEQVILCERGIRTFEKYTRNTLDLSAVPIIHEKTHLPIIVDPSHATGKANLVEPMMIAAVAAGADGLEVEVHYDPRHAWSDGAQCLTPDAFAQAMAKCRQVAWAIGRDM